MEAVGERFRFVNGPDSPRSAHDSPFVVTIEAIVVAGQRSDLYCGFLTSWSSLGTLREAVELRIQRYAWTTRLQFAYDFVRGVKMLHQIGAFNGDLNPHNVLLVETDDALAMIRAKIFDLEAHGGRTPDFSDPDLSKEDDPSEAQDIYSVGCMLKWLARGDAAQVPIWYVQVAEQCVGLLDRRPSIDTIVQVFDQHVADTLN